MAIWHSIYSWACISKLYFSKNLFISSYRKLFILFRIYNDFSLLILKVCFLLFYFISILKFLSIFLTLATVGFCLFLFC